MNSKNTHLSIMIGVFLFVAGIRVYVIAESGMRGVDDAYITYRYAENIAQGYGFVYNVGERVLGVTTPLYTILLALFALVKLPLPLVSQILGVIASGVTGALLFSYSRRIIPASFALIPALLYALWPNVINTDVSGMEMSLFVLAVVSFFYTLLIARYRMALIIAALAALLRPEGALLAGLYFLFKYTLTQRSFTRDYLPDLIILAGFLLPWLIFASLYFGSPVPNSVTAKLALYSAIETTGPLNRIAGLLHLSSPVGWIIVFGALWGVGYSLMRVYWGWLEILFALTILGSLAFNNIHIFFWYLAPIATLQALFLGIGVGGASSLFKELTGSRRLVQIVGVALILGALPTAGSRFSSAVSYNKQEARIYKTERRRAGEYLQHIAEKSAVTPVLVAEDIGYPGYYFHGKIIDRDGLITPTAIERNRFAEYVAFLEDCLSSYPGHWLALNRNSPLTPQILEAGILDNRYQLDSSFVRNGFATEASQGYLLYRAGGRSKQ